MLTASTWIKHALQRRPSFAFFPFYNFSVWGVEPVVTHQTCWLKSTGVCGVREQQAGGTPMRRCHDVDSKAYGLNMRCRASIAASQ